jgi:hypothetical protein
MKTLLAHLIICGGLLLTPVTSEAWHHRRCCCQCGPVCTCGPSCACPGCAVHARAVRAILRTKMYDESWSRPLLCESSAKPACGATCTYGPTLNKFDKLPGDPFKPACGATCANPTPKPKGK